MNLVYGSFCPLHEGNKRCPCRTLTTNASIWTAADLGDTERVRTLVKDKGRSPDSLDPHGYTPLHLAAQQGRLPVVRFLLQAGASPDGVPQAAGGCGATPLHRAAYSGQLPCVQALLGAGADPSAQDASFGDMKTPLHKAVDQGHRDIAVALLGAGADPSAADSVGNSPIDVLLLSWTPSPCSRANLRRENCGIADGAGDGDGVEAGAGSAGEGSNVGGCNSSTDGRATPHSNDCNAFMMQAGGYDKEKDWEGIRQALERYGSRRRRRHCDESLDAGAGCGRNIAHGDDGRNITDGGIRSSSGRGVRVGEGCERTEAVGSPSISAKVREIDPVGLNMMRSHSGELQARIEVENKGEARNGYSVSVTSITRTTPATDGYEARKVATSVKQLVARDDTADFARKSDCGRIGIANRDSSYRADGRRGESSNTGVPCSECQLPKVVMVRASCCAGLLCKPCVRDINLRRCKCRRCRDSS